MNLAKRNRRLVYIILVGAIVIGAAFLFVAQEKSRQPKIVLRALATYTNPDFKVSLAYPSTWQVDPARGAFRGVPLSFRGDDGFFGVDAVGVVGNINIDGAAKSLTQGDKKSYGLSPSISSSTIAGTDARFILPSPDQPKGKNSEAAIVIQYPRPVEIGDHTYLYFMLYGDKLHLREIARTLRFVGL